MVTPAAGTIEHADVALMLARSVIAAALARAWSDPFRESPDAPAPDGDLLAEAWRVIVSGVGPMSRARLGPNEHSPAGDSPGALVGWLATPASIRAEAYAHVFGFAVSKDCPPFETEYLASRDAAARAQHLADLGGFYAAFGVRPWPAHPERPDHVAAIIAFAGFLGEKRARAWDDDERSRAAVRDAVCRDAACAFLRDHAAWWIPAFAAACARRIRAVFPACGGEDAAPSEPAGSVAEALRRLLGVARFTGAWIAAERKLAGVEPARRLAQADVPEEAPDESNECGSCDTCSPGNAP